MNRKKKGEEEDEDVDEDDDAEGKRKKKRRGWWGRRGDFDRDSATYLGCIGYFSITQSGVFTKSLLFIYACTCRCVYHN